MRAKNRCYNHTKSENQFVLTKILILVLGTLEMGDPSHPPMMFLHGWPDTSALYANQFVAFCRQFYCISPSWIDFHPDMQLADRSEHTWKTQIDYFKAVIDELELTDITFVIFDFGANLGYQMLSLYPEKFKRVIALDIGMGNGNNCTGICKPMGDSMLPSMESYQQVNIQAYRDQDDNYMWDTGMNGEGAMKTWPFPCSNLFYDPANNGQPSYEGEVCAIGPGATPGTVGAVTGWPYQEIIRNTPASTGGWPGEIFPGVALDDYVFSVVPDLSRDVPILFLFEKNIEI